MSNTRKDAANILKTVAPKEIALEFILVHSGENNTVGKILRDTLPTLQNYELTTSALKDAVPRIDVELASDKSEYMFSPIKEDVEAKLEKIAALQEMVSPLYDQLINASMGRPVDTETLDKAADALFYMVEKNREMVQEVNRTPAAQIAQIEALDLGNSSDGSDPFEKMFEVLGEVMADKHYEKTKLRHFDSANTLLDGMYDNYTKRVDFWEKLQDSIKTLSTEIKREASLPKTKS